MIDITRALIRAAPFFSFVIGLGISVLLFHRNYDSFRALALPLSEVEGTISRSDGKCYRYRVEDATCEIPSTQ
jgi:hypothetical protein